jgi:hypothetical protein
MRKLGTPENPCRSNKEINRIIIGMQNCNIYTLKTFEISEENLEQAKARNVAFVGLAVAYWTTPSLPVAAAKVKMEENIAEIRIDKHTKVPMNLDEIAKHITEQFNVNADVFEKQFSKTADQFKTKYLGRFN